VRDVDSTVSIETYSVIYRSWLLLVADLHLFALDQPDLNWDNHEVREAIHDMMRFWLEKGLMGLESQLTPMALRITFNDS
jgi:hypothetical protein